MRLTVHHSQNILPIWQNSLDKLLDRHLLTEADAKALGNWHIATFNDRIVGLSITQGNQLRYFSVRDITRRRGIGRYLLAETIRTLIAEQYNLIELDRNTVASEELESLDAFLLQAGFTRQENKWVRTI